MLVSLVGQGECWFVSIGSSRSIFAFSAIRPLGSLEMVACLPGSLAFFRLGQRWRIKEWKRREVG